MLTKRDMLMMDLIAKLHCLSSEQIHKLIYKDVSIDFMRARLRKLVERKELKRIRYHIDQQYIYYMNKLPKQMLHINKIVDTYIALNCPDIFAVQKQIGDVIPDGYTEINKKSYFIEIHFFNGFNFDKYTEFHNKNWQKYFKTFPDVIIITDKNLKIPQSRVNYHLVKLDLSNLWEVMK
jgi:hypothetical protein